MPADDFGNARPGELHSADNLVADDGVIGHFAEFLGIERSSFCEQPFVNRDLAYVVQVTRRTQSCNVVHWHVHGFADGGGVTPYAQGMSMNVDVLYVNGGRERFEGAVVKAVQQSH